MDAFWIKLLVLAVLVVVFALTVWMTSRLFGSPEEKPEPEDPRAPGERARDARTPRRPD